jgi:predicted GNAT family acetyltransferase
MGGVSINQIAQPTVVTPSGGRWPDRTLLDGIRAFLVRNEATNTFQLSGFAAREDFDPKATVLVAVDGANVVGVATQGGSFLMLLSHIEAPLVIDALVDAVVDREIEIPGVMGPATAALAFAQRWSERTGRSFVPGMAQRILATSRVKPPADVPGRWRQVTDDDHPMLTTWFTEFLMEADGAPPETARSGGEAMLRRLDARSGGLIWLDDDGAPVSIACFKAPTMNGIRIGPVYTPSAYRRRGYAAAVTAATTQRLLDQGYSFVCLYTDAANLTANHVYEGIGYEHVVDSMQYRFTEQ